MAKFAATLGVVTYEENTDVYASGDGVFSKVIREYVISGDMLQNRQHINFANHANQSIELSMRFSFIAPSSVMALAIGNTERFACYLDIWGTKWEVSNISVQPPRIELTIGGVWNEET